ncbi:MAG TPA: peptidase domain-containing ABC transporter [Ohtaekwangia sp.]|uniref:peptidase domain-containing ABC transporter n=1 Tax=Ohtaekwangia sp. TaxID=2066019 RepID=UPI002F943D3E
MTDKRIRKYFTRQHDRSDCGAACLASIIRYHGGNISIERIRELTGTSAQGATLAALSQAAGAFGLHAEGFLVKDVAGLKNMKEPAILHVLIDDRLHHYVVCYGADEKGFIIGDPASGIKHYSAEVLDKVWSTRALLTLTPNQEFIRSEVDQRKKRQWLYALIRDDIGMLGVMLSIGMIVTLLSLSTALFSKKLIDDILPAGNKEKLIFCLLLVILLLLGRSGLAYLRSFFIIHQGRDFNNRIIQKFYSSLLRLPKSFFDTRKIGDLIARMNDTRRIQSTLNLLTSNMLIDLLLVVVSAIFILLYSWIAGCVVLFFIPIYCLLALRFSKPIVTAQKEVMKGYAHAEGYYIDSIHGIASIKSAGREPFFEKFNRQIYGRYQDEIYQLGKVNIHFAILADVIGVLLIGIVFAIAAQLVLSKQLSSGQLVAIIAMTGNIVPSVTRLVILNMQIQEAKVVFNRMFEFTSIEPEYTLPASAPVAIHFQSLTLQTVTFQFPGHPVLLNAVSLHIKKGQCIALTGESGCGKSTLLQIIQRFYRPGAGAILVNDQPWEHIDTVSWRNAMAVVSQDVKIFNGTLLYNICLSDLPVDAARAIQLAKESGFDTFFEKFPQGYLTIIGEEGINLSGGQKQLVALARALFKRPQLLLLDEATASMDKTMEAFILALLQSMQPHLAILWITHQPQMIHWADRIYMLKKATTCL